MAKKTLLSALILIVTVVGIAATMLYVVLEQEKIKNRLYEPTDITNVVMTLYRSRCFGICPVYNVTIYGNGTVVYEGIANVNSTGMRVSTISEYLVRQLLSEFKNINYFSLNDTEISSHVVYDAPLFTTSLSINGKTNMIHHYETADPQTLTALENTIDDIVNSNQWIK
jgi:hypothetical protein